MADMTQEFHEDSLAIVGMVGRFPGAENIDVFWHNLKNGVESISFFNDDDMTKAGIESSLFRNPRFVKAKGLLENSELFDASFFGYSPAEAQWIDPQQRVFLESAWEVLENAGYDPEWYEGAVGVFAGTTLSSFLRGHDIFSLESPESPENNNRLITLFGADKDHLVTRVSYKLNLKGPGITVQTACSTSLVAVCMACQSLLMYQCDMALAGGVSITLPEKAGYIYQEGGILSPDGHCRTFDAAANGTVGGNGVGIVLLKRLKEAYEDGDTIHAVIKGFALNNDGSAKIGYTAPSIEGQSEVVALAQAMAGVDAETVTYLEAHGTATPLGDPIEITALTRAFRAATAKRGFCAIGSVKTNIGHLDAAAGVAGLIKTVLALKNKMIPPSLHYEKPNPEIDFESSPFFVNDNLSHWDPSCGIRRAGVSAFGIGGTNAHVVLEEAPQVRQQPAAWPHELVVLSAKTETALRSSARRLASHLKEKSDLPLSDVAHTLQVGRRMFSHRLTLLAHDTVDAAMALENMDPQRVSTAAGERAPAPCVFMFSGQGNQYPNMALDLYRRWPLFRHFADRCFKLLITGPGLKLENILFPDDRHLESAADQLKKTDMAQPALFVVEYALARSLMHLGIRPKAMIGHSIGEYVAACLAGVFSLEDGLKLVYRRGRLMGSQPEGAMSAVRLPAEALEPLLSDGVSLASVNGPSICVVSGTIEAIVELERRLDERGHDYSRLKTSHAYHSAMMAPAMDPFLETVKSINLNPPKIKYVSNVTGTWITSEQATRPSYWTRHLRETVFVSQGMERLMKIPDPIFLEVGPGNSMVNMVKQLSKEQAADSLIRHPHDPRDDLAILLSALGRIWRAGTPIEWPRLRTGPARPRRVPLTTYPFERQRFHFMRTVSNHVQPPPSQKPVKHADPEKWIYLPTWKSSPPPLAGTKYSGTTMPGDQWLMFADRDGFGRQLADRMVQAGCPVVVVGTGKGFAVVGENEYTIDPHNRSDYDALYRELQLLGRKPGRIVHLWSLTREKPGSLEQAMELGFYSLLYSAQALTDIGVTSRVSLFAVTNQVQSVTGNESLEPGKAMILGPCKVIQQEHYTLPHVSIDIELPRSGSAHEKWLIENLVAEITAEHSEPVLAYRGRRRWVQSYEAMPNPPQAAPCPRLREKGVYLITGGLGRMGLEIATFLAKTVRARLILTARSPLAPHSDANRRSEGSVALPNGIQLKQEKIRTIEQLGGQVLISATDVADMSAMQQLIKAAEDRFGRINGVVHAAGVVQGASMAQFEKITRLNCEDQFRPKVKGLLVLKQLFTKRPLDFCLLTSSLASVLGGVGFIAYAAANQFMDTIANLQHRNGDDSWISVNWDGWKLSRAQASTGQSATAALAMNADEGIEALSRVLNLESVSQVAVSTASLQTRIEQWVKRQPATPVKDVNTLTRYARPDLTSRYAAPRTETQQRLVAVWQDFFAIDRIGIHDNFFEIGGDSLMAMQMIARLHSEIGIELSLAKLMELETVDALATYIDAVNWAVKTANDFSEGPTGERERIDL